MQGSIVRDRTDAHAGRFSECFGIELTMNNVGALFFHSYFGMSVTVAGAIASIWGATNLFARSIGGLISDYMNKNYGVRGRLWAYWFVQTLEGSLCVILALITLGLDAPHGQGEPSLAPWVHLAVLVLRTNPVPKQQRAVFRGCMFAAIRIRGVRGRT